MPANFNLINEICTIDCEELAEKEQSYGDSWKQRGGVGAFMMLARKWDRIENQCREEAGYDIFEVIAEQGIENNNGGIIDDIRDLRRYLLLVEQHMISEMDGGTYKGVGDPIVDAVLSAEPEAHGYVNQDGPDHLNTIKQAVSKPLRA